MACGLGADLLNASTIPAALKMYDRALDIEPNDPDLNAAKAGIHQAEGDLEQAGKLLAAVDAHTASFRAFATKITQLSLERNYLEAVRLPQARQAQFQLVLKTKRARINTDWPWSSALLAIASAQKLRLRKRAVRSSRSTKTNKIMRRLRDCYP
jgi:tetratricopeptide (TPR) repeat protein